jgi:hypothetical protein
MKAVVEYAAPGERKIPAGGGRRKILISPA